MPVLTDTLHDAIFRLTRWCPALVEMPTVNGEQPRSKLPSIMLAVVVQLLTVTAGGVFAAYMVARDNTRDLAELRKDLDLIQVLVTERGANIARNNERLARLESQVSTIETTVRAGTDDRYRGSDARRDQDRIDRQFAELRDRLSKLESRPR